jgi:hypothetical protein
MRQTRPDPEDYVISMYTHDWDPASEEPGRIRDEMTSLEEAGVQHVVAAIHQRDSASWRKSVEDLARILGL